MPLVQSACASGNPERMRERERVRALCFSGEFRRFRGRSNAGLWGVEGIFVGYGFVGRCVCGE